MKSSLVKALHVLLLSYLHICFSFFYLCKGIFLVEICYTVLWILKLLLKSDDNHLQFLAPQSPAVRIVNDATFQQSSDPVRGLEA